MIRIQRKRTKGWRMPENTEYVGRPGKWGNPIKLIGDLIYIDAQYRRKILDQWVFYRTGDIDDVIALYRNLWDATKWDTTRFENKDLQYWADRFSELDLKEIEGKDLACFCPLSAPCHANILLEMANS